MMFKYSISLIILAGCLTGCGMGTPRDNKLPFNGTVTWNGEPLKAGALTLTGAEGDLDAAVIQDGAFRVRTKPGMKTVSVTSERKLGVPVATPSNPSPAAVTFQFLPASVNDRSDVKKEFSSDSRKISIELSGIELVPPSAILKDLSK
ncbi:hypothetical protein SH661x_000984 [Planctomicrobium sp. SH661]|uniref:hypothetical protein n=1 Tax=Planctomicrobium sp. SH661 TaxID=3448124 RepID=UPI003F5CB009